MTSAAESKANETAKAKRKLNELEKRLFDAALGEMSPEELRLFDPDLALEILCRRRPGKWAEVKNRGVAKPATPNGQGAKLVEQYLAQQVASKGKKSGKAEDK